MPRIRLTGHLDVPPHARDAVRRALPAHIAATRGEPGCLSFEVFPDASVPGRWQVRELFASRTAFEKHQARVAASLWGAVAAEAVRDYSIEEVEV